MADRTITPAMRARLRDVRWLTEQAKTRSDWEIGRELGCRENYVRVARERFSIPSAGNANHPLRNRKIFAELCRTHSDAELGAMFELTARAIRSHRSNHNIVRNGRAGAKETVRVDDEQGYLPPPPKYEENPPQETPGDVMSVLAVCPRCHWTTSLGLIRWGRTERWQPEPDQKLRFMPGGGVIHRECETLMRLHR